MSARKKGIYLCKMGKSILAYYRGDTTPAHLTHWVRTEWCSAAPHTLVHASQGLCDGFAMVKWV